MTQRLESSSAASALNPVIGAGSPMGSPSRRADGNAHPGNPGASFSDMLKQHQGDNASPTVAATNPASTGASQAQLAARQEARIADTARSNSAGNAARLAERQAADRAADARRSAQALQQANRDATAMTERQTQERQQAEKSASKDDQKKPDDGANAKEASRTANKDTGHRHHLKGEKARGSDGDEAELKNPLARRAKTADDAAADPAVAQQTAAPTAAGVSDPAEAARQALAQARGAAHAGTHAPAQTDAAEAGVADRMAGKGKPGLDLTAGAKLAEQAKADAASKAVDEQMSAALKGRADPATQGADASFAATLKTLGADQQSQDGARGAASQGHQATNSLPDRLDGVAGSAHAAGVNGQHRPIDAPPAATQVPFATPTTSPDFAQALGVSIANLATTGVQQAELHLNPAETGPIAVQITIDGTQAQIDFQAANAHTRDAIFSGMPELAAALNAQGLTLTGGGVTEHGRGGRGDGGGRDNANSGSADRRLAALGEDLPAGRPAPALSRLPRGAVDVYA